MFQKKKFFDAFPIELWIQQFNSKKIGPNLIFNQSCIEQHGKVGGVS